MAQTIRLASTCAFLSCANVGAPIAYAQSQATKAAAAPSAGGITKAQILDVGLRTITLNITVNPPTLSELFPFDEPFTLAIDSKGRADLLGIDVRLLPVRRSEEPTPDCKQAAGWVQNLPAGGNATSGFHVVVHPLPADRYIRGCLFVQRKPSEDDAPVIIARITDQLLATLPEVAAMSNAGYTTTTAREMQRRLLLAARQVPGVDSVAPISGSALDERVAGSAPDVIQRRLKLSGFVGAVVDAYSNAVENVEDARRVLQRQAEDLRTDSTLRIAIASALQAKNDASSRQLARRLWQLDSIVQDAEWTRRFAKGEIVPDGDTLRFVASPPTRTARSAADLSTALSHVQRTRVWLADLATRLKSTSSAIAKEIEQSPSDVGRVADSIGAIASNMESLETETEGVQQRLTIRRLEVEKLAGDLAVVVLESITFFGSTIADLATRAKSRVAVDIGATTLWRVRQVEPTLGLNFYFAPVNKRVPLSLAPPGFVSQLVRRVSLGLGLTTSATGITGREDVFSGKSPVISVGYRIWDVFRISAGALPMRASKRGTFANGKRWTLEPAVTLSLDNDVRDIVKDFVGLVWPKAIN